MTWMLLLASASVAAAPLFAADCSLSGVVKTKDGQPVGKTQIVVTGAERGTMRVAKSSKGDGQGRFLFEKLKCGKYFIQAVSAMSGQPMQVDISSNPSIELIVEPAKSVAEVMKQAQETMQQMTEAQNKADHPELGALRRSYLEQISPGSVAAYDKGSPHQRRMIYQSAWGTRMMAYYSGEQATIDMSAINRMSEMASGGRRPTREQMEQMRALSKQVEAMQGEAAARGINTWAADLVRKALSEEEARNYLSSSEMDRSALLFRAAAAMPAPAASCGKFALYLVDMEDMYPMSESGAQIATLAGHSGSEWKGLDAKQRCDTLTQSRGGLLKLAMSVAGDSDEQHVASLMRSVKMFQNRGEAETVGEAFGSAAAARYHSAAPPEKKQLYRAALTLQLAMMAAMLAD